MRLISQPVAPWRPVMRHQAPLAAPQAPAPTAPQGGAGPAMPQGWQQALDRIAAEARRFMAMLAGPSAQPWTIDLPLEGVRLAPAPRPQPKPTRKPRPQPAPAADALARMSTGELARLGRTDKRRFFAVLRPAAEAAERKYGVPAAITLAQAALETGWGQHIIPGYNLFGIKGKGPAGSVRKGTWEVYDGKKVTITATFAKYHHFYEAVEMHGKLFHNGYYTKAMNNWKRYHDPVRFARDITGVYATDPRYGDKLVSIMRQYDLI